MKSREQTVRLFAYGTLCDPAVQRILFGAEPALQPAVLPGWSRRRGEDGYLFIRPDEGCAVKGQILSLTAEQLEMADCWEAVPLYRRERVSVSGDAGLQEAWAYTRRDAEGELFEGTALSGHPPAAVLEAARSCRRLISPTGA